MKKIFLQSILLFFAATTLSAQTILKGDMNDDNEVTIADVTSVVNVVLGKAPLETISAGCSCEPYKVDNTSVVGTWYAADGTSFSFNEDGTTTFPGGATYEFMPMQGRLLVYDAMKHPIKVLPLIKVESEYLLSVDYATSVFTYYTNSGSLATGITISQTSLSMNSGTTAQLSATLSPEGAFGSVTWTSSNESVATVDANGVVTAVAGGNCTITATASGSLQTATCSVSVTQMVTSITLSQTSVVLELDDFVTFTATVLPANAANKNVVWSSSNEDVAIIRNGRVAPFDYGTTIITCTAADGSGVTATCKVNVINAVDLGLPSGTLWATCNIGANSPEEYGDYFAWGETEGHNSGKTSFKWNTYKWCIAPWYTPDAKNILTKYCTDSVYGHEGFTDGKTELDLEDDAAYVNWGPAWRMPSKEQFEELFNSSYTTVVTATQNGKKGIKVTSKSNYNSIFLRGTGQFYQNFISLEGTTGHYWTRSIDSPSYYAWEFYFNSSDVSTMSVGACDHCYGLSVRPVRSK